MNCQLTASLKSLRRSILVIGYGNSLHGTTTIGQQIAYEIESWNMPNVEAIAVPRLTPDLTDKLSIVDAAIFIGVYPASLDQAVLIRSLQPSDTEPKTNHWFNPSTLLRMTQTRYGNCPQAWKVMVPGAPFEKRDRLSSTTNQTIETALDQIDSLFQSIRKNSMSDS